MGLTELGPWRPTPTPMSSSLWATFPWATAAATAAAAEEVTAELGGAGMPASGAPLCIRGQPTGSERASGREGTRRIGAGGALLLTWRIFKMSEPTAPPALDACGWIGSGEMAGRHKRGLGAGSTRSSLAECAWEDAACLPRMTPQPGLM